MPRAAIAYRDHVVKCEQCQKHEADHALSRCSTGRKLALAYLKEKR